MKNVAECGTSVTKEEALNCVEYLLIEDDISLEEYNALTTVIKMMRRGKIDLGDGVCLTVIDDSARKTIVA